MNLLIEKYLPFILTAMTSFILGYVLAVLRKSKYEKDMQIMIVKLHILNTTLMEWLEETPFGRIHCKMDGTS